MVINQALFYEKQMYPFFNKICENFLSKKNKKKRIFLILKLKDTYLCTRIEKHLNK